MSSSLSRQFLKAERRADDKTLVSFVDQQSQRSSIADRRFSEMVPRRPSVMSDRLVQWNENEGETRKSGVFHRKRPSRVIQSGRLSSLSPADASHDIETSGEVINGIGAKCASPSDGNCSRDSQILQSLNNE